MAQVALPPAIQAILNTVGGAMGTIGYAGWGSFGPGPAALLAGLASPAIIRFSPYIPEAGWDPVAKAVIAEIINAVGGGDIEEGVLDTPQPVVYPVFTGPSIILDKFEPEISSQDAEPVFLPSWPDEWKKQPGDVPGWDPNQWEYPEQPEEEPVAFWDGVSAVVDVIQGQAVGGGLVGGPSQVGYAPMGAPVPSSFPAAAGGKVTVDTKTGKVTPCRRRRRRRLLTPTDLNDLAALKTIVGGGQSMNFAVMKAVRR